MLRAASNGSGNGHMSYSFKQVAEILFCSQLSTFAGPIGSVLDIKPSIKKQVVMCQLRYRVVELLSRNTTLLWQEQEAVARET